MNCMKREQLFAYSQGMSKPRKEAKIRAHLAECPACRGAVEAFRRLDALLDEWKPTEPSPWFDARVRAAVAAGARPQPSPLLWAWRRWLSPALLGVLLVAVGMALVQVRRAQVAMRELAGPTASGSHTTQRGPIEAASASSAEEELVMYENLSVLEDKDYDLLAKFDLLSDLPRGEGRVAN